MSDDPMSDDPGFPLPLVGPPRKRFEELRLNLLRLHKILLESERASYERVNGPVGSTGRLLSLVMSDPWFDWLHRISEMVVEMDLLLESDNGTIAGASDLVERTRTLLRAGGEDSEFMRRYKAVLQRDPAAVNAHAEVQRTLRPDT